MKIYTEIMIDIETNRVESAVSYEYDGPVSLCKGGGGGSTTSVDTAYNAGLLAISQEQEAMAAKLFNTYMYGVEYDPSAIDEATGKTLGEVKGYDPTAQTSEAQYSKNVIAANQEVLPMQTEAEKAQLGLTSESIAAQRELLPLSTDIRKTFASRVLEPVDVTKKMNEAQAEVQQAAGLEGQTFKREMFSSGVNPADPIFATTINARSLDTAKNIAMARTKAKDTAEATELARLQSAMTAGF